MIEGMNVVFRARGGLESAMDPSAWLEKNVLGFVSLSGQEREAIKDFSLLWSLYEGRILNASGSANAIIHAVNWLRGSGKFSLEPLSPAIEYFCKRYFDGDLTYAFQELHLRSNDHRALVEKVVQGRSSDDAEILSAILIIVFRLRNNLFHGVKWSYGNQRPTGELSQRERPLDVSHGNASSILDDTHLS
jgi:hypothetical protein